MFFGDGGQPLAGLVDSFQRFGDAGEVNFRAAFENGLQMLRHGYFITNREGDFGPVDFQIGRALPGHEKRGFIGMEMALGITTSWVVWLEYYHADMNAGDGFGWDSDPDGYVPGIADFLENIEAGIVPLDRQFFGQRRFVTGQGEFRENDYV